MKANPLLLVLGVLGWSLALACQGQVNPNGTVTFANSSSTRVINVLTGQPVAPDAVRVGLYFSVDLGAVPRLDVPEDGFKVARVGNLIAPGIFVVGTVLIPETLQGQWVLLQVRIWSAAYDTYGDAVTHNDPLLGASRLIQVSLGGGILPTPSLVVQGHLRSFLAGYLPAANVPVALPGVVTVVQDLILTAQLAAWDPEGDMLTFVLDRPPAQGAISIQPSGQFTYAPFPGSLGDSFTFMVSDGQFTSPPGTVTVVFVANIGTLAFNNGLTNLVLDGRTGQPVEKSLAMAGLYFSTDTNAMATPGQPGDPFQLVASAPVSDELPASQLGRFDGGTVSMPGTVAGQKILVQVRCWPVGFESFEQAVLEPEPLVAVSAVIGPLALGTPGLAPPQLAVTPQLGPMTLRFLRGTHSPVALAAGLTTTTGVTLNGTVAGIDPDGDALTFAVATAPSHGTLFLQSDGKFSYAPSLGYVGFDAFDFQASDGSLVSEPATVTIDVKPPSGGSDGIVLLANSSSTAVTNALTGQRVVPGAVSVGLYYSKNLTAMPQLDAPQDGFDIAHVTRIFTAGLFNGGTVPIPGANPNQSVLLQVRVWSADFGTYGEAVTNNDLLLGASNLMQVRLGGGNFSTPSLVAQGRLQPFLAGHLPPTNPPVALTGAIVVLQNTVFTSQLSASDPDGDELTFAMASPPALGVVTIQPGGQFTYVPFPGSLGNDSFAFVVSDGQFTSPTAIITVTIHPNAGTLVFNNGGSNRVLDGRTGLPVANGQVVAGLYVSTDLSAAATPGLPGDPFQRVAVTAVSDGLPATAVGHFDGGTLLLPGTLPGQNILVQVRCWPVGLESFEQAVLEPEPLVAVSDVVGPMTLGTPGLATPQVAAAPEFRPVTLRFLRGSHPPAALAANFSTLNNASLAGTVTGSDPDGDTLAFAVAAPPGHGTLTLQAGGQFSYRPATGYAGVDWFSFHVTDGQFSSAPATVTITVTPSNPSGGVVSFANSFSAPVIDGRTGQPMGSGLTKAGLYYSTDLQASVDPTMAEDDLILARVATILAGGIFIGGSTTIPGTTPGALVLFQVRIWSAAFGSYADAFAHGDNLLGASNPFTLHVGGGSLPDPTLVGQGGLGSITTGTVPRPHPPTAQNLAFTLEEDTPLSGQLLASDADGDPLAFSILSPPALGALNLSPSGGFDYLPRPNISGFDSFSFLVNDGKENSAPAIVTLAILPINDLPAADFEIYPKIPWITTGPNPVILSPNNSNAVVVLDGSLSSDIDGSALEFGWFEGTGTAPFATEGIAQVTLDIGLHTITLQASDGFTSGAFETTLEVITPGAAVELLILEVSESTLDRNSKKPLISILKSAVASFERDSFASALNQLGAFQNSVHAKLKKSDPDLAQRWTDIAGEIVRTVSGE